MFQDEIMEKKIKENQPSRLGIGLNLKDPDLVCCIHVLSYCSKANKEKSIQMKDTGRVFLHSH